MNQTPTKIHLFEQAGLGKAPFFFVDFIERPSACAYCGQYIKNNCIIRDINGKVFAVGPICVYKTGDAGIVSVVREQVAKQRRLATGRRVQAALKVFYSNEQVQAYLKTIPHPVISGKSMYDYCDYFLSHQFLKTENLQLGSDGHLRAAKQVENAEKLLKGGL